MVQCSVSVAIISKFMIWLGALGLSSEAPTPPGHLGQSSERGLESWGKLPTGPRHHFCLPLGLAPSLPPLSLLPSSLHWSPRSSPGAPPMAPAEAAPLAALGTSSSLPSLVPAFPAAFVDFKHSQTFCLVCYPGKSTHQKLFIESTGLCVCFNFFPFHFFQKEGL